MLHFDLCPRVELAAFHRMAESASALAGAAESKTSDEKAAELDGAGTADATPTSRSWSKKKSGKEKRREKRLRNEPLRVHTIYGL